MHKQPSIKIENRSVVSNTAQVTIGDQIIPVTDIVVRMRVGEYVQVELTTRADYVDVEALQKNTELNIVKLLPSHDADDHDDY